MVVDGNWSRLKIKSPQYVALAFLDARGDATLNEQKMLKIVRENESDEFLSYYKQWSALCAYVRERFERTVEVLVRFLAPRKKSSKPLSLDPATDAALADLQKRGDTTALAVREYLCSLPITKCEALVNALSPVNWERRNAMLEQQQIDMDASGVNTKKKKVMSESTCQVSVF